MGFSVLGSGRHPLSETVAALSLQLKAAAVLKKAAVLSLLLTRVTPFLMQCSCRPCVGQRRPRRLSAQAVFSRMGTAVLPRSPLTTCRGGEVVMPRELPSMRKAAPSARAAGAPQRP